MTKHYCGNVVYDSDERMLLTDEGYVNRGDGVFDSITNWLDDTLWVAKGNRKLKEYLEIWEGIA